MDHHQNQRRGPGALLAVAVLGLIVVPSSPARADGPSTRPVEATSKTAEKTAEGHWARRAEALLDAPGYRDGHWGALVVDAKTGETVFERDADQLFAPASVTKLFSTAAALVELGPNHRFQTPLMRRGEIDAKGTLHGDLILIAQGDPCLGGRTGPDGALVFKDEDHTYGRGNLNSEIVATDPLAGLEHLAREARAAGIQEIAGDVIVDDRLFERAWSTGSGPRRVSPITINDNVIDVLAEPASKAGEPARVTFAPATAFLTMDAQVATVEKGQKAKLTVRSAGDRRFTVRGQLPVGHRRVMTIHEVEDPAAFARALLIEALRRRGTRVTASPLGENSTEGLPSTAETARLPKVAEYTSPPFRENVRVILKVSLNLHASTLPLLLAARHGERTLDAGLRRQGEALTKLGVPARGVCFGGGAGGDRADMATPRATVALLRAMAARPEEFPAYEAALPILGRDGTLASTVGPDSPARGHVRAKTGTYFVENGLNGKRLLTSKALAGYIETASGRRLVFAAFLNNLPLGVPGPDGAPPQTTSDAGRMLGKLCEIFYDDNGHEKQAKAPADSDTKQSSNAAPAEAPPDKGKNR